MLRRNSNVCILLRFRTQTVFFSYFKSTSWSATLPSRTSWAVENNTNCLINYHYYYTFNTDSNNIGIQTRLCNADLLNWIQYIERKNCLNEENLPIGFYTQKENQGYKKLFFDSLIKHLLCYYVSTRRVIIHVACRCENFIENDHPYLLILLLQGEFLLLDLFQLITEIELGGFLLELGKLVLVFRHFLQGRFHTEVITKCCTIKYILSTNFSTT
ncbi:hypothetical protein ALC53_08288 [Atta colombica]|uniref:Uncharacterized protein n=1 Tax=Atta colombica TaxID=520822 RepID=A0A195BAG5_9HYME|nr:hypothetical protein ALC53_08288 [Atta colombica]